MTNYKHFNYSKIITVLFLLILSIIAFFQNTAYAISNENLFLIDKLKSLSSLRENTIRTDLNSTIVFSNLSDRQIEFAATVSANVPNLNLDIAELLCDSEKIRINKTISLFLGHLDSQKWQLQISSKTNDLESCSKELISNAEFHKELGEIAKNLKERYNSLNESTFKTIQQIQEDSNNEFGSYSALKNHPELAFDFIFNLNEKEHNNSAFRSVKIDDLKKSILQKEELRNLLNESLSIAIVATVTGQFEIDIAIAARILSKLPAAAMAIEDASVFLNSVHLGKLKDLTIFQLNTKMTRNELLILKSMLRDPKYRSQIMDKLKNYL